MWLWWFCWLRGWRYVKWFCCFLWWGWLLWWFFLFFFVGCVVGVVWLLVVLGWFFWVVWFCLVVCDRGFGIGLFVWLLLDFEVVWWYKVVNDYDVGFCRFYIVCFLWGCSICCNSWYFFECCELYLWVLWFLICWYVVCGR